MRLNRLLVLVPTTLLLTAALAGCSGDDEPDEPSGSGSPTAVEFEKGNPNAGEPSDWVARLNENKETAADALADIDPGLRKAGKGVLLDVCRSLKEGTNGNALVAEVREAFAEETDSGKRLGPKDAAALVGVVLQYVCPQ